MFSGFPLSDREASFWRKIKFFCKPRKAHEVGMGGGTIGMDPIHSALTVMSSENETNH